MKNIKINKITLVILCFIFLLGMLLCAVFTSPLFPYSLGDDSALFTLIGKGITEGKVVYKDLFDHKGPILFFIEAFGYFFGGRTGIFILQCIFGLVNLFLSYKIWVKLRQNQANNGFIDLLIVFITGCAYFFFVFQHGNLSEEYSLPFIFLSILLFVNYALKSESDPKHPYWYSFFHGVTLSILVFIRLNNTITVISGVFAILLYLIYKKEYKNIFVNILFGLLGVCVTCLPIVIYFALKSALFDMLYATFIYNFKYAGNIGHQSIIANLSKFAVLYLPIVISILLIALRIKSSKKITFLNFMLIIIVIFNAVVLIVANIYPHYFTVYVPVFILVLSANFTFERKKFKNLMLYLLSLICVLNVGISVAKQFYANHIINNQKEIYTCVSDAVKIIPEDEKDSVVGFNFPCSYYLYADIVPCFKYYTHQEWWSKNDPKIIDSFVEHINSGGASWLLILPNEDNEDVLRVVSEKYELVEENRCMKLYKFKKK